MLKEIIQEKNFKCRWQGQTPEFVLDKIYKNRNNKDRVDISDDIYASFSYIRNDEKILGYRSQLHVRNVKIGMGGKMFYFWEPIFTKEYNVN